MQPSLQIRNARGIEERKEENMKKMRSELFNDGAKPKGNQLAGGGNKSTYMDQNKGNNSRNNSPNNIKAQE